MYLKSIEIQGFKSFANKIVLEFHNGITGIVGPNGSGKSNVADAVRWVLGEQKVKQLRSSSMQDVIFAGTENRRPVSFAYVAITLDNSDHSLALDYNEVTVTRRVYRSGESEYLLNGSACRLKDIHELFYDTGIGKEGYSIIGQGQIDRILSGKPEERRELFDEAAGIVKFKRRKQMTMKKLEAEQQNMVRITDILTELERQIGPLERQSEHARIYLKKREELKNCEVNLFLLDMERVEKEEQSVREKQEIAEHQQSEASAEFEKTRQQYEELDARMQENDARITELQNQIGETDVEKEKLEGRINVLQEQIRTIEQSESHVRERLDALEADIDKRQQTGQQYSDEKAETDRLIVGKEAEKQQLAAALEELQKKAADCERQIEAGKSEILALLDARAGIEGGQQRFTAMIEQADIRKAQLQQQLLERKSTGTDVAGQLQQQEEELDSLNEKILRMEKKKIEVDQKRRKWRRQAEELSKTYDELRQQTIRESSRLESLRNIAERYDGYGNSIRRVMERRSDTPGIHGVVADLIKVDKRYETAIETALGGSIQNIVTDNENTAKQMIAYLKQNKYGRATFLPLTSVSAPENVPAKKALHEQGALGMADTLVKTDEKYRGVAGYLLGRVLVADTIDHAIAIEKKFHYSLRIVTLEGESLQPGGSMTGGTFRNNSNLLGRNREIASLEKAIREHGEEGKKIQERLENVRTADELLKDDFEELQGSLQDLYLRQNTLQVEVEHLQEEQAQQESFFANLQQEMQKLEDEKNEAESDRQQVLLRVKLSREREAEITAKGEVLAGEQSQIQTEIDAMQAQISDVTVEIAQLQQKADFSRENIQRVAEEILSLHQKQQEVLLNASNSGQEIESRNREIEEMTRASGEASVRRESLSAELEQCTADKETMAREHKGFFDRREELSGELSRLDKELFRLNDQWEKLEHTRETQTEHMWQEYELTLHEAMKVRRPIPDVGEEAFDDEDAEKLVVGERDSDGGDSTDAVNQIGQKAGELESGFDAESREKHAPGVMEKTLSIADLKKRIAGVKEEIHKLGNVNVNAIEEYKSVSERYTFLKAQHEDLQQAEKTLEDIIADLDDGMKKQFAEKFADIQVEFNRAFRELFGGGKGTLELDMRDDDKDILECGVRIIAQPPGKKLQNMMQLSGGEKALTAIALLFAIQNLKPSPFCLLDEIEAALDDSNVDRYAGYLHKLTEHTQFIVITHRRGTMIAADRLYGITMQEKGVSTLVSVDLIESELDE
ncbi:MAG: chromosome segregation protein SMC [Clostridiales bacterium]|nr:chromosome segregation protein SMC [Clostridiales bacterium]